MAEAEGVANADVPPVERARALFRAGPIRDPGDATSVCRFLLLETPERILEPPTGLVDPSNRCVAIGEPLPQSARQQELVCLTSAHANCPRFLRGTLVSDLPVPRPRREPVSPAVIGAALVLAASLAASFGFLAVRGGFSVPLASRSPAAVVAVGPSATPTPAGSATPAGSSPSGGSASPVAVSSPPPTSAPTPTPEPTPGPTVRPTPVPTAAPTRTPAATSDRFQLLTKCPDRADCWIYVIRAGDNLRSIANYFGVSFDRMLAMNPNLRVPIHARDELRIPTPTR